MDDLLDILLALREYLPSVTLVGGWVPELYRRFGGFDEWRSELSRTREADILVPAAMPRGDRGSVADALRSAGFQLDRGERIAAGIVTSTFGVGEDFDERLLRDLAHEGGGNFYFIEHPAQIPDLLTSELGEALEVVMRGAALHVSLPPGVEARPLNRYRHLHAGGDSELRVELGDLASGQELSAVIELRFPSGAEGTRLETRVALGSEDSLGMHAEGVVEWSYAGHAANDAQPRERVVDREVARLYAARARGEATEANRHGDLHEARRVLEATARRISGYAGRDPELNRIVSELRDGVSIFADEIMSPIMLKTALFSAEAAVKGRGSDGRARRRPAP